MTGFQLHKEDKTHFTLKHSLGDELKIAKVNLSPELHQNIRSLPQTQQSQLPSKGKKTKQSFDDGGQVQQDTQTTQQEAQTPDNANNVDADRDPNSLLSNLFKTRIDATTPGNQPNPSASSQQAQQTAGPQVALSKVPLGRTNLSQNGRAAQFPNFYGQMQGAVSGEQKALGQEAAAQGQLGQAQAPISHQEAVNQQALMAEHNQHLQSIYQDMQNSVNDIKNGNIDPSHWWNSKSTGGKILTVIGTILGGANGVRRLQAEIQNDAQAQIQNKTMAARAYLDEYKNETDAMHALSLNQTAVTNALLQEQAQKAASPMAQAHAQAQSHQLMMEAIPQMQGLAMSRLMQSQMGNMNAAPESMIRLTGMMGASNQEKDKMYSELDSMSKLRALRDNYFDTFDKLHNMTLAGKFSPNAKAALTDPLMEALTKDTSGRVTPTNVELLKQSLPAALDSGSTRVLKRQKAEEFFKRQANSSLLKAYGIPNPMDSVNTATPR